MVTNRLMSRLSAARAAARRANEALRAIRVQPSPRVIERSQNCCSLSSADPLEPTQLPQDISEPNTSQSLMAEGEQKSADECEDAIPHTLTFTIASYRREINLDPTNALFYLGRADVYSMKKNHVMAIVDAEKAIELNPRLLRAYSRLG
jgi:tetratricopeptide (TPR) repeat protein